MNIQKIYTFYVAHEDFGLEKCVFYPIRMSDTYYIYILLQIVMC